MKFADACRSSRLLLRGSPLTLEQLVHDAARTARRFTFDDFPCHGISVELAVDNDDVDRLLREGRVRTREFVARIPTADVTRDGFIVLPTFAAPHQTVVALRAPDASVFYADELAATGCLRSE